MSQFISDILSSRRRKRSKRVGRGDSSGKGRTDGRGMKGQASRSGIGRKIKPWFEGGQTPLHRRIGKKKGFTHRVTKPVAITVAMLNQHFSNKETVSLETLQEKGLLRASQVKYGVKIIGTGQILATIAPEICSSRSRLKVKKNDGNIKTDLARQAAKR